MNVSQAIHTKRAVRLFTDQPVPNDVIQQILDAGRRSQSSKNTQPWGFVAIRSRDTLVALSKMGDFAGHLAGANFAVLLVGDQGQLWNGSTGKATTSGRLPPICSWPPGI